MNTDQKKLDRKEFERLLTVEQRTLVARLDVIQDMIEKQWRWDMKRLEEAENDLATDLEVFGCELNDSPVFQKMPRLRDHFDYVWAMFFKWGEPGTQVWSSAHLENSALSDLSVEDFFIVLAWGEWSRAVDDLLYYAMALGSGTTAEEAWRLQEAAASTQCAERALSFALTHMPTSKNQT